MELQFNWKHKDYELRAIPKNPVRLKPTDENYTIELIKWRNDSCFTLAYWTEREDGYVLAFVGSRPLDEIELGDIQTIWKQLVKAQKILNNFYIEKGE